MNKSLPLFLLFSVILIEGYVVLSTELLAIRQTIPFVGSGTDTLSIIIAAVLMPLAVGYHVGGQFTPGFQSGQYHSIRQKLLENLSIAQIFLLFGLSYYFLNMFFSTLLQNSIGNRFLLTSLYSGLFIVTPVYLLGQTIPLVSNYFSKERLAEVTGKMLFISTLGSFLGAVFTSVVLMSIIGVHYTAVLSIAALSALITLLSRDRRSQVALRSWGLAAFALLINSGWVMSGFHIVENNQYNTVVAFETQDARYLMLNGNSSSMLGHNGERHKYIEFMEKIAVAPVLDANPPKNILVIGSGGFTFGHLDHNNSYDFVDIDGSLKDIAETYILKEKLAPNKHFHPVPARAYLSQNKTKYDVIILDAYLGGISIPEHLVTREFFQQVKDALNDRGVAVANFIANPSFDDPFSRRIDSTWRAVFPFPRGTSLMIAMIYGLMARTIWSTRFISTKSATVKMTKAFTPIIKTRFFWINPNQF